MNSNSILKDLTHLACDRPELHLLQFRTLISARQYARLYQLIAERLRPDSRVLDWGCGNGHASYALNAMGHQVIGYALQDIPPMNSMLPAARFVIGNKSDPRTLPFADKSFDAVLSVGVLEHVRETGGDELSSLQEINRVLKPDGVFICYHLPNRHSYLEAIATLIPDAHSHQYRYTRSDIDSLCKSAGLTILDCQRYGALPRNPWQSARPYIGNSRIAADVWDAIDKIATLVASPVVQNYYFVAKPK